MKKIGLVLGSGGVNGAAHLELIKKLNSIKIFPDVITGSSAGAIIGALYADGGAAKVKHFFDEMTKRKIFHRSTVLVYAPGRDYNKIEHLLRELLDAKKFSDLKIPFACAGTDLVTGESVIMREGELIDSVMASCAVPGIFKPRVVGGRFVADGGVVSALPVEAAKKLGAQYIIGSFLDSFDDISFEHAKRMSRVSVYNRTIDIIRRPAQLALVEKTDFCFRFPVADIPWHTFQSKDVTAERAKKTLKKQIPAFVNSLKQEEVL